MPPFIRFARGQQQPQRKPVATDAPDDGGDDAGPIPLVDLKANYRAHRAAIDASMGEVLSSCWFVGGPKVAAFERAFADFCGTRECIGVNSGTDALTLALRFLGVGPGDEVITQANTFVATCLAISQVGATPVLVDATADGAANGE